MRLSRPCHRGNIPRTTERVRRRSGASPARPRVAGVLVLLLVVGAATMSVARLRAGSNKIRGCVNKQTKLVRIIPINKSCKANETFKTWNVKGRPGAAGAAGRPVPSAPPALEGERRARGCHGCDGADRPRRHRRLRRRSRRHRCDGADRFDRPVGLITAVTIVSNASAANSLDKSVTATCTGGMKVRGGGYVIPGRWT